MSRFHGHPNRFHPIFQWRLNMILGELRALGWKPKVHSEAFRTLEQEKQKVKDGTSHTLHSWHVIGNRRWMAHGHSQIDVIFGNAADIVDERWGWDGPAANPMFKFWTDLGRAAKNTGASGVETGKTNTGNQGQTPLISNSNTLRCHLNQALTFRLP